MEMVEFLNFTIKVKIHFAFKLKFLRRGWSANFDETGEGMDGLNS